MVIHYLEYSPSSRAGCQGDYPCKGSPIPKGVLRYGGQFERGRREFVKWRHWECVTPQILRAIGKVRPESTVGWYTLRAEDQERIRQAIKDKTVHAAVARSTAPTSSSSQATEKKKKRKASFVEPSFTSTSATSRAVVDAPASRVPNAIYPPTASQMFEVAEEADVDVQEEEEPPEELYTTLNTNIVGVQYYKGLVGYGEHVKLEREPNNQYDRNAIKVLNINNTQVGHVPRNVAAKLAPLLDQGKVTVEGTMLEGNMSGFKYSLSMSVKIYGRADQRQTLEPLLIWATPGQRGFGPSSSQRSKVPATQMHPTPAYTSYHDPYSTPYNSVPHKPYAPALTPAQEAAQKKLVEDMKKAAELREVLDNLQKIDDEGRRASLLDQLLSTGDVLTLPEYPNPPGIDAGNLTVNLLKHQKQALLWCIDRENPVLPKSETDHPVQFWQLKKTEGKTFYFNLATKTPQETLPKLGRGALCADSMGLGKTLTMISLILATKSDSSPGFSEITLIGKLTLVPLSVLSNWQTQIDEHCVPGALTYITYYGTNRNLSTEELAKYDVVLTTYQTVVNDHSGVSKIVVEGSSKRKKTESTLSSIPWKRIIIDEGHQIRNPSTKAAVAVSALTAERRWVLTGTPILNSPKDLGSLLTFLKTCRPLDRPEFFNQLILRPLKYGEPTGAELLRGIMTQICIRRTKEMQDSVGNSLVPLPPVDMIVVPVALDPKARELYDAVEEASRGKVEGLLRTGGLNFSTGALSMLTRLRQLALHPGLVPANYLEQLKISEDNDQVHGVIQVTPAERIRLQGLLFQAMEDNEECPICYGALTDPRITPCTHTYCFPCITEAIARDPRCPMDRRNIGLRDLIEPPPVTDLTQAPVRSDDDETDDYLRTGSSAKIDQLIHLLRLTPSTEKSLVFSQFTSFLDKIGDALDDRGIEYCRFDGKMSAKRRAETIAKFCVPVKDTPLMADEEAVGMSSRLRHTTQFQSQQMEIDDDGDNASDFVPDDRSDYSDTEFDGDEKPQSKRGKGKGKGKAPAKSRILEALKELDGESNPRVMLISLKAGALGLNLTVANNVFLMDPWWQEGIESQAIDRCNRIGQTKPVHVYQLIAENTVESKVLEIQGKKKNLVREAFSGMKNKETPLQRREARLQDIIALFGIQAGQPSAAAG
ncbi:hypothetical protein BDM02DRAFT_3164771 [Thelephora ganbajun]|uniref:Uncharacterized protein n=1 Tax=Thelephora ganbajun TaxID=370292 RepID=A0ACB6ZM16_THEGA|nr:hypothetical protein BDM02DRAFT_3164771 [Thelephora ganbajun]